MSCIFVFHDSKKTTIDECWGVFSGSVYFFTLGNLDQLFAVTVLYRADRCEGTPHAGDAESLELRFADPTSFRMARGIIRSQLDDRAASGRFDG